MFFAALVEYMRLGSGMKEDWFFSNGKLSMLTISVLHKGSDLKTNGVLYSCTRGLFTILLEKVLERA